ncbi:hypothetical protein BGZ57DRAFT_727644, partial [Hyaloscypha finlandica]
REVSQALATITLIITKYNSNSIDIYFLNYKSKDISELSKGIIAMRYKGIKRAIIITKIFEGTPTSTRVYNILNPYLAKLKKVIRESKEVKLMNLIILINSIPLDNIELVLLFIVKKLDKLNAPL